MEREKLNHKLNQVHNLLFFLFAIESLLIMLGIVLEKISYGIDVQTPLMGYIILGILFIFALITMSLHFLDQTPYKILRIIFSMIILAVGLYYVLEDNFKLINLGFSS